MGGIFSASASGHTLESLENYSILEKMGMASAAEEFLKSAPNGIADKEIAHMGRVIFLKRPDMAREVFESPYFIERLGDDAGLEIIGMLNKGVIWNNDNEAWKMMRKEFTKALQSQKALSAAVDLSVKSFEWATNKVLLAAADDKHDGTVNRFAIQPLQLMRLTTFLVTVQLTLGLPLGAMSYDEAMQVVHKVDKYFKAWQYFLIPRIHSFHNDNDKHQHTPLPSSEYEEHKQAVDDIKAAIKELINMAESKAQQDAHVDDHHHPDLGDMLLDQECGLFLRRLRQLQAEDKIGEEQVQQGVLEMVIAGTDTSSVTMFNLLMACRDDVSLERLLMHEALHRVHEVGGVHKLQHAHVQPSLMHKSLLDQALNESMRFKPVGPIVIRKTNAACTLKGDCNASEVMLNKGDTVVVSLVEMHKDPSMLVDATRFDIRNFTDMCAMGRDVLSNANVNSRQGLFRPFGHGIKGCVGHIVAFVEMRVIMTCWLTTFQFCRRSSALAAGGGGGGCVDDDATTSNAWTLETLPVKWEVANQPTVKVVADVSLLPHAAIQLAGLTLLPDDDAWLWSLRQSSVRCICLSGVHSCGKTSIMDALVTLVSASNAFVDSPERREEVARTIIKKEGISKKSLEADDSLFCRLQHLVVHAMLQRETKSEGASLSSSSASASCLSSSRVCLQDRGLIDPLAYMAWRFGRQSAEFEELLNDAATQELIAMYKQEHHLTVLVHPFSCTASSVPDGVRLESSAQESERFTVVARDLLQELQVPFVQVLGEGSVSERVDELGRQVAAWLRENVTPSNEQAS